MRLLLERGAQISRRDMYGDLPVEIAAAPGYVSVVKLLLQAGEDPDIRNKHARKALLKAFDRGKVEVVQFIIDSEVDPTECLGLDELHKLASDFHSGNNSATLRLILAKWPNIDAPGNTGQTLLRQATKLGDRQLVSAILEQEINTETRDFNGKQTFNLQPERARLALYGPCWMRKRTLLPRRLSLGIQRFIGPLRLVT